MDTGLTRENLRQTIRARHSASLQVCTRRDRPVTCWRVGMPDHSVVGDGGDRASVERSHEHRGRPGAQHLLRLGPPGAGTSRLGHRIIAILPATILTEALDTTRLHRVAGCIGSCTALVTTRPFRAPHHTILEVGLIGGGQVPEPGEVLLAHHGVRFLDELSEFRRHVLEVLRQALEKSITTV